MQNPTITGVQTTRAGTYSVTATVSGCTGPAGTTTVTVNTLPAITGQPQSATVCAPGTNQFSVTATGTGLSYQWYWGTPGSGTIISGATSSTYTTGTAGSYYVVVSGTCTPAVTSNAATLTVNTAPNITGQPQNATVCSPNTQQFSVTATGTGLSYQWYSGVPGSGTIISGATSSSYTTGNAGSYYVVVSGTCSPSATSAAATLTVNTAPSITGQPQSATVCTPNTNPFSVTATGSGLSYQWYSGTPGSGTIISGATSSTYTTGTAGSYYAVVSGSCAPAATSSAATLTVDCYSPILTITPPSGVCSGAAASFSLHYTDQDNGDSLTV